MQPDPIAPLQAKLASLPGVGSAMAPLLARACGGDRVLDVLLHMPASYIDRRARSTIADAVPGRLATVELTVTRLIPGAGPRTPTRVAVHDPTGTAELVFFGRFPAGRLIPGARIIASGKFEIDGYDGRLRMVHPDHLVTADDAAGLPWVEPVWPLTAGLSAWRMRKTMVAALARLPDLPEWHDAPLMAREHWPAFAEAVRAVQAPDVPPDGSARRRLAYDELLAHQVALALVRRRNRARPGRALTGDGALRARALAAFGFPLTPSQAVALAEIDADLAAPARMMRLLQGDVGSGKTLVAALAMLRAAEAGAQAAIMAPTEILARQHLRTLDRISPVPVGLLAGSVQGRARARVLEGLADGSIPLAIGTHALLSEGVVFRDLALAVIDEQHRFGVDQRLLLGRKGTGTDVLVMTATPIPRTLLLTHWGEMQVSRLTGKPAGRPPIDTTLHSLDKLPDVVEAVARKVAAGGRVYWVCPLVSENEASDLAAAEARYASLRARFGDAVGLAHGQMDAPVRESALAAFTSGAVRVLVATTVVEVGVDVPEASVMVIEHAERFGLAALHQLRGRVGRGTEPSFCLLLFDSPLTAAAKARLELLRETDDGFLIADEDFRLRGGGDLLGTRQSGGPGWKVADPVEHEGLLHMAAGDAALLLDRDPGLTADRGRAVRVLLRLYDRTTAFRTLDSG